MIYHCCDARRRELVLADAVLNGIDFIEVLDLEAPENTPRQRTLLLRFLKPAPDLTLDNLELSGGERITGVEIEWVTRADAPDLSLIDPIEAGLPGFLTALPEADQVLVLRTSSNGDYATYTLRLVSTLGALSPPAGIDRLLSQVDFSFKVECPTDFDCAPRNDCPGDLTDNPAISYLAKDYQSFRRLMLNRMAQIMPDWRERNPADLGITLVEMLAFTGDRLSYAQDAVATEAYLATARRRSSVRRHARLVDYQMHDGGNARVWIQISVDVDGVIIRQNEEQFLTRLTGLDPVVAPASRDRVLNRLPLVFEPLHDKELFAAHNAMDFYEWGDAECCLTRGATRATLAGNFPDLANGDILIFEEWVGPRTGRGADADPNIRHAVRLCAIESGLTDELTGAEITEIRWAEEDALPFPFCISATLDDAVGGGPVNRVSHALGNILLADHGRSVSGEELSRVPAPYLSLVAEPTNDACERADPIPVAPRYRPALELGPVTQLSPDYDPDISPSAFDATDQRIDNRRPDVRLDDDLTPSERWLARRDLLQSFADDRHFVVETERDGRARLRFGDDRNGRRPNARTGFSASYRVGNGAIGNIGADALRHVITDQGGIIELRNPLPATGGANPESMEEVRKAAPYAYRRQERAVTADDYADLARRYPDVQRAAATFRWNGHGHTVFVTVDRFGGRPVTSEFEAGLRSFLDRFRMAGYDLEIDAPRFVALELGLFVCASPEHFRSEVRREVMAVLGTAGFSDGTLGHFHPDNLSFGEAVYLSPIYAAVMAVEGVTSVKATRFRRRGTTTTTPLKDGVIALGRLEIAQLENNPNFPERGAITIEMGGGK
ncbi:putative baseplate assembly protein [Pelagibius sp. Alg239-R121]|uniref:putative baseplate assembly protein n=1 Tax=Pelagibius sp. Alg239-R121 TaxID=2993448 RepID=UPI0024A758A7|nr:putative baseplate assembly protein [Pelagibius sp. Alg239-R121]